MSTSESDFKRILDEYEALRTRAAYDQNERVQKVYEAVPEIQSIDREIESFGLTAMQRYLRTHTDPHTLIREIRVHVDSLVERKTALLTNAGFPADYMELRYQCPICKDTGYVGNEKCRCLKQRLIALAYERSNLNPSTDAENFDRFDPDRFSPAAPEQGGISPRANILRIREAALTAIDSFSETAGMNFLFYGATGTGKTFLCSCIAREILNRGYTVLYLSAYDFCMLLNDYRFRKRGAEETDSASRRVELIDTCDLLILDDLGTEASNSASVADILHCIHKRIQEQRSTILSTNLGMQQIQKVYSDRMLSRLMGYYRIFRFFGPDLRRAV